MLDLFSNPFHIQTYDHWREVTHKNKRDICAQCHFHGEKIAFLLLCPDWLHACDQGVGADIAGNLLVEVAQKCLGNNFKERLSHLWKDIQKLYVEFHTPYKFQTFNSEGPPTLKGLAAQVRYMVPLLPVLTNKYLDMSVAHNLACHRLARFLAQAYEAMECNDTAALLKAGQKMAQQYVELEKEALEKENSTDFHIMPKLHLFQHLCEMKHPKDTWCYKDETLDTLCPSSSPEEVEKTILDTMLVKSWTDGLTAILFLFCDCLLEKGRSKKMLGVLFACLKKATKNNDLFKMLGVLFTCLKKATKKTIIFSLPNIYLYRQKLENWASQQLSAQKLSCWEAQFSSFCRIKHDKIQQP